MENGKNKKLGAFSLGAVFMAYFCSITAVPTGALVGQGSDFKTGLAGIILGFVIGAILISLSTLIGYKTGLKKDAVWKQMFGRQGFKILSFAVAFCMAFWACFDLFNAAQAVYNVFPEGYKDFGFALAMVILLVVTILGGVFGMDGVKLISNLTIPVAIVLFIIIYVVSWNQAGGLEGLLAYQPEKQTYTVLIIAQTMVGMWMAGYLGAIDLTTDAKDTKAVVFAATSGSAFVLLCFLVGQVGFMGTGVQTLADICASLGGAIFIIGSIFVMIAQGNTTPACDYMYSNSFAAVFNTTRKWFAIILPLVAGAISFVIMYGPGVDFITTIVNTIGTIMSPLVAVMLCDFYFVRKGHLEIKEEKDLPAFNKKPTIGFVVGLIFSFVLKLFPSVTLSTFVVLIVTGVFYTIIAKIGTNDNPQIAASEGK